MTTLGTIDTGTWQGTAIADSYIASSSTWDGKQDALTFGISNTNAVKIDSASVADDEYARFTANGLESRSVSEVLSDIGAQASLTFGLANGNALKSEEALSSNDVLLAGSSNIKGRTYSEFKTDLSLNNVENTALSTWAGTSNIVTVGTIGAGTWQGTAVADGYIASASTWNGKQDALTFGIANNNAVEIDHATVADNDYAKFTANGLEGRSYSEVKSDLSLSNVTNDAQLPLTGGTMSGAIDMNANDIDMSNGRFMDVNRITFNQGGTFDVFLDEDDMSSNDSAGLASQQSIKTYVDNQYHNVHCDSVTFRCGVINTYYISTQSLGTSIAASDFGAAELQYTLFNCPTDRKLKSFN